MNFFFLNLFISVMLENFSEMESGEKSTSNPVKPADFEKFISTWSKYDPDATGRIPVEVLQSLLLDMPPPLGLGHLADPGEHMALSSLRATLHAEIAGLGLSVRNNQVHLQELLFALVDRACGISGSEHSGNDIRRLQQMNSRIQRVQARNAKKATSKEEGGKRKPLFARMGDAITDGCKGICSRESRRTSLAAEEEDGSWIAKIDNGNVDMRAVQAAMTIQYHYQRYKIRSRLKMAGSGSSATMSLIAARGRQRRRTSGRESSALVGEGAQERRSRGRSVACARGSSAASVPPDFKTRSASVPTDFA